MFKQQNRNMHIMTHHRSPEKQMLTHLRNFVASHQDWIKKVGAKHFEKIGVPYKKYVREIFNLERQFDILTILIFARCFHIHICIIVSQGYWTTQAKNKNVHQCEITLGYSGTGLFSDTKIREEPLLSLPSPMQPTQSSAINLSGRKRPRRNYNSDEKKKRENAREENEVSHQKHGVVARSRNPSSGPARPHLVRGSSSWRMCCQLRKEDFPSQKT